MVEEGRGNARMFKGKGLKKEIIGGMESGEV